MVNTLIILWDTTTGHSTLRDSRISFTSRSACSPRHHDCERGRLDMCGEAAMDVVPGVPRSSTNNVYGFTDKPISWRLYWRLSCFPTDQNFHRTNLTQHRRRRWMECRKLAEPVVLIYEPNQTWLVCMIWKFRSGLISYDLHIPGMWDLANTSRAGLLLVSSVFWNV
jgi:hypothetical protein